MKVRDKGSGSPEPTRTGEAQAKSLSQKLEPHLTTEMAAEEQIHSVFVWFVKPGLLEHEVSKPLQGNFFLVWRHPPYVRKPGLLEHEVSKTLQGMNFFVVWQRPPCVGKPGLLEHGVSKTLQGMKFFVVWRCPPCTA